MVLLKYWANFIIMVINWCLRQFQLHYIFSIYYRYGCIHPLYCICMCVFTCSTHTYMFYVCIDTNFSTFYFFPTHSWNCWILTSTSTSYSMYEGYNLFVNSGCSCFIELLVFYNLFTHHGWKCLSKCYALKCMFAKSISLCPWLCSFSL